MTEWLVSWVRLRADGGRGCLWTGLEVGERSYATVASRRRQSVLASRPGRCRVLLVPYSLFGYVLVFVFVCGWYTSVPFIHFLDSYFSIHYAVICGRLYYVLFLSVERDDQLTSGYFVCNSTLFKEFISKLSFYRIIFLKIKNEMKLFFWVLIVD